MIDRGRVSLIIPAYNEAPRIGAVLEAAVQSLYIHNIIVVDDGSTDFTGEVATDYEYVAVMQHSENLGKGAAMDTGYRLAKEFGSNVLLFMDADLRGLKPEHITSLVEPVTSDVASMTIGILERTKLQKAVLKRWGAFSGQRALPIDAWGLLTSKDKSGFNVEAALNSRFRHEGLHRDIQRVELSGVTHVGKREKEATLTKAGLAYARTYGAALLSYARIELS